MKKNHNVVLFKFFFFFFYNFSNWINRTKLVRGLCKALKGLTLSFLYPHTTFTTKLSPRDFVGLALLL